MTQVSVEPFENGLQIYFQHVHVSNNIFFTQTFYGKKKQLISYSKNEDVTYIYNS